jgi:ataxin-3
MSIDSKVDTSFFSIYHEKQDAALCGMHALNNLLQNSFFSPDTLIPLAEQLDQQELSLSSSNGISSSSRQESNNISDSGDFSVQVISKALDIMGLQLHSLTKSEMAPSRQNPSRERAFLCNLDDHWLAVRRFCNDWFEIDSAKNTPIWFSPTHIGLYLEQLIQCGYAVFAVVGNWHDTPADDYYRHSPYRPPKAKPTSSSPTSLLHTSPNKQSVKAQLQEDIDTACALSMVEQALAHSSSPKSICGDDNTVRSDDIIVSRVQQQCDHRQQQQQQQQQHCPIISTSVFSEACDGNNNNNATTEKKKILCCTTTQGGDDVTTETAGFESVAGAGRSVDDEEDEELALAIELSLS